MSLCRCANKWTFVDRGNEDNYKVVLCKYFLPRILNCKQCYLRVATSVQLGRKECYCIDIVRIVLDVQCETTSVDCTVVAYSVMLSVSYSRELVCCAELCHRTTSCA